MKVLIKETNELGELEYIWNGIDCTKDLADIATNGSFILDRENEYYIADEDTFNWWKEYITDSMADDEEEERLREIYDSNKVFEIINEELAHCNDYDQHHNLRQYAFKRIREELKGLEGCQ